MTRVFNTAPQCSGATGHCRSRPHCALVRLRSSIAPIETQVSRAHCSAQPRGCADEDLVAEQPSTSYTPQRRARGADEASLSRRGAVLLLAGGCALVAAGGRPAAASKVPFLDAGWEALGGGPADLVFPEEFLGEWEVMSVLSRVETPLGEGAVPNPAALRRAQREDLGRPSAYRVAFVRNGAGRVVYDRRFNTAAMLSMYYDGTMSFDNRIEWNIDDPNILTVNMPGMSVRTRVTRRSEESPAADRIETSEYVESVFDNGGEGSAPRIKASQCFTKYKWRSEQDAARDQGPAIVATQIVSDYLTPYDGEQQYLMAMNKPYAQYHYRMSFRRPASGDPGK